MRRTRRTATASVAAGNALNGSITGSGTGTGLSCTVANSGCPSLSAGPGIQDGCASAQPDGDRRPLSGRVRRPGPAGLRRLRDQPGCRLHRPEDAGGPRHHDNARQQVQRHLQRPELRQRRRCGNLCRVHRRRQRHRWQDQRPVGLAAVGRRTSCWVTWLGAKYVNGPWTVGIVGEEYWEQGTVTLAGLSQRKARAPRHRRGLRGGARLLGVCRVSLYGSDAERQQLPHRGGWYGGCRHRERRQLQQQRQVSGLPDRQRRELLSSTRLRRNGRREAIPAAFFLANVGLAH